LKEIFAAKSRYGDKRLSKSNPIILVNELEINSMYTVRK